MLFLHKLQIRSSTFVPIYLPFLMFKLWALILNFVNSFLCCLVPNNKYGSNLKIDLNFLYVLDLFLEFGLTLLSSFRLCPVLFEYVRVERHAVPDWLIGSIGWCLGPQHLGGLRPRYKISLTLLMDILLCCHNAR
jgi:hypothetical protein